MLTPDELVDLLKRPEGTTLDFKATAYDLGTDDGRYALVKDMICMANTPRTETAYVICGVKKHPSGAYDVWGLHSFPDEATLQSQFAERVYPIPSFRYYALPIDGKDVGVFELPIAQTGPSAPLRDFGSTLRQWQIYFRRGSRNDVATPADQRAIVQWFSGVPTPPTIDTSSAWERLLDATGSYSADFGHVLVLSPGVSDLAGFSALGDLPWNAVFDFDPTSDSSGALAAVSPRLSGKRSIHRVTLRDPQPSGTVTSTN